MTSLPLSPGDRGEAVRDLQRRLTAAGCLSERAEPGTFCSRTADALLAFQIERGLRESSVCDAETWRALVEASWSLGDRLLLLVAPNLRGDDVAELQSMLSRLGFDCGRVDGIFGPDTAAALADFQENSGLCVDVVCGPDTVKALRTVMHKTGSGQGVPAFREAAELQSRSLAELRIVVGQFGGLSALTRRLVLALRQRSATVSASDEPDAAAQAAAANRFSADAYIGFEFDPAERSSVCYYKVPQFESVGGHLFADAMHHHLGRRISTWDGEVRGMRRPILRETRMPAVLISLGSVSAAVQDSALLVEGTVAAIEQWAVQPQRSVSGILSTSI